MGKTYVVFVGRESGIYDTWVEASNHVNGFKGIVHQSFKSREEAEKAFQAYLNKKSAPISFTSSEKERLRVASSSLSSSNSRKKLLSSEKITKLKDALEDLKQHLNSLQISDDD